MPPEKKSDLFPVFLNTILALSVLYAPQPLLPVLSQEFAVSREAAAALTTVTFIPLALAPLAYGYLLETVSPVRVLRLAVPLLAASELLFSMTTVFSLLIVVRLGQGLLVPAILTSLMTYVSNRSSSETIQRTMAMYIAATILGGFLGRVISGLIASLFNWRVSFIILAISLLLGFMSLGRLSHIPPKKLIRPHPDTILKILKKPGFLDLYLAVFCLFLVFAAVMNFLPFRLTELTTDADELRIGLMYSGYLTGIVSSLGAPRVIGWSGGETRTIRFGLAALGLTLVGLAGHQIWLLFCTMFLFCAAMFLVHSTASGFVNRMAGSEFRGLTNGLYVAFYYAGGSVGSFAPGLIYQHFGWSGFLISLAFICALGYLCICRLAWRQTPV